MIEQKWIEIINRSLDGELSPEEQQELDEFLTHNIEATEYRRELEQMAHTIDETPESDPPSNMRERIIREIGSHSRETTHRSSRGIVESIKELMAPRIVYPFATGLAAGVAVFALWVNQPASMDDNGLSGTIGLVESAPTAEVVARHEIDLPEIRGFVETQRHGNIVRLVIEGTAQSTSVLELAYDQSDLATHGYTQARSGQPFVASVGRISAILDGSDRYEFFFEDLTGQDSEILVQIPSEGSHHHIRISTGERTD